MTTTNAVPARGIQAVTRTVYRAPTKGRSYLTPRAAAKAEAAAILREKYPTEKPDYEDGRMEYPGYHWSDDPKLVAIHKRLVRFLLHRLKAGTTTTSKETA